MENIKKIFETLKTIQGNGSFETSGIEKLILPGLYIKGVGEIGFPISPMQVREIIKISKKAPFGKGGQTITDTTVRSAWELNADLLSFHNEDWKGFMEKIAGKVKTGLGIEDNAVTLSLYKLLIYEEGDFFLPHKDSEKEPGMFGTLIIGLPSVHAGGELAIRFADKEKIIDFSVPASNYKIPYVAFFADCDHEVKPITSGYRAVLAYNLLQSPGAQKLGQLEMSSQIEQMATLLKSMSNSVSNKPKAILLEHQYTPANFSLNSLKHHDRPRAELLLEAAKKADCFASLGLVTHYQMGELEGGGYDYDDYRSRSGNKRSDSGTMGSVYEEYTAIKHWSDGKTPALGKINIEKEDLIADFEIGEDAPLEKEEEGYTGNAGMTMTYWYHYGAIILWPQSKHRELLLSAPVPVRLEWLEYYYQNWDHAPLNSIEYGKYIMAQFTESELTARCLFLSDFSITARVLLKLNDENFILDNCEALLASAFKKIRVEDWIKLLQQFDSKIFTAIFERAARIGNIDSVNHILEILSRLSSSPSKSSEHFFQRYINYVPVYLEAADLSKLKDENRYEETKGSTRQNAVTAVLKKTIELSHFKETDADWIKQALEAITKSLRRKYVNEVLAAVALSDEKSVLAREIRKACISDLADRTAVKPTPPPDWKKETPNTKGNRRIWNILKPFLESAEAQVFEYKRNLSDRGEMAAAISRVTIDLKMEIVKKSSPHILKITKTNAAYERALKHWQEDTAILQTLR